MAIENENRFFFNCPLNLALRNELFFKIEKKTCPELKHFIEIVIIGVIKKTCMQFVAA